MAQARSATSLAARTADSEQRQNRGRTEAALPLFFQRIIRREGRRDEGGTKTQETARGPAASDGGMVLGEGQMGT